MHFSSCDSRGTGFYMCMFMAFHFRISVMFSIILAASIKKRLSAVYYLHFKMAEVPRSDMILIITGEDTFQEIYIVKFSDKC